MIFGVLLTIWEVSGAVRAIMGALNEIYEIVFLVGAQAEELVRKDATAGERGMLDHVRAALR